MSCGSCYVTGKSSFPLNSHLLRHQFNLFSLSLSLSRPSPPSSLSAVPAFIQKQMYWAASSSLSLSLNPRRSCSTFPFSLSSHLFFFPLGAFLLLTLQPVISIFLQLLFEYLVRMKVTFYVCKNELWMESKTSREYPVVSAGEGFMSPTTAPKLPFLWHPPGISLSSNTD